MYDFVIQSLFKLVTEPITEGYIKVSTFGFRKKRSAIQSLAKLCTIIISKQNAKNIVLFSFKIKGFLNNINFN